MQGIFGRLQKCLAVGITAQFTGGRKDSCVYKIGKDRVKVIRDLTGVSDISADVIQP